MIVSAVIITVGADIRGLLSTVGHPKQFLMLLFEVSIIRFSEDYGRVYFVLVAKLANQFKIFLQKIGFFRN